MTKPRGLGRGLDALLGGAPKEGNTISTHPDEVHGFPASSASRERVNAVQHIPIADIEANPNQPRREFDVDGLRQLAASIEAHGIIQPITLRKVRASKFQIISGERRFRAAQQAGLPELPAYIREADDQSLLEMALVENIQRQDLNPLEVGMSFRHLMEECDLTQESLAKRVGMGRSSVANFLRMLELPEQLQGMLRAGQLGLGHAKALAGLRGPDAKYTQIALAEKTVAEGVSVRELERWVKQGGWKAPTKKQSVDTRESLSADEEQALNLIRTKLSSTQATIAMKRNKRGGGQLTVSYKTLDELEAVLTKLGLG
ncbi:MAG: ParB/RepB/Spo0J family partition protein [Bacteroidota bacterium]|nr:ParB/RepB/Spo0J family partition protein [Bacteroidota bacterium]